MAESVQDIKIVNASTLSPALEQKILAEQSCGACLKSCTEYKKVYEENGDRNEELYTILSRFFQPKHLNKSTTFCLPCWNHVAEFHAYLNQVVENQRTFDDYKETDEILNANMAPLLESFSQKLAMDSEKPCTSSSLYTKIKEEEFDSEDEDEDDEDEDDEEEPSSQDEFLSDDSEINEMMADNSDEFDGEDDEDDEDEEMSEEEEEIIVPVKTPAKKTAPKKAPASAKKTPEPKAAAAKKAPASAKKTPEPKAAAAKKTPASAKKTPAKQTVVKQEPVVAPISPVKQTIVKAEPISPEKSLEIAAVVKEERESPEKTLPISAIVKVEPELSFVITEVVKEEPVSPTKAAAKKTPAKPRASAAKKQALDESLDTSQSKRPARQRKSLNTSYQEDTDSDENKPSTSAKRGPKRPKKN